MEGIEECQRWIGAGGKAVDDNAHCACHLTEYDTSILDQAKDGVCALWWRGRAKPAGWQGAARALD